MQNNPDSQLAIDVQGLTKSFGDHKVVDNIDLQVRHGQVYGFLGPNGSGKTTTIRMICGLLKPDAGSGHCLGLDILKEALAIKAQVGYMTQHFSLYDDLTIKENLDFVARVYQLKQRKILVQESLDHLGFGKTRQKQLAGNLSGGWKQRLALAAALIHRPKVLLLDEPTAGVDPSARREFWDEIHELSKQGITTLVSTHYMDEAERCNQLAYIAYGHMLTKGNINEIIKSSGLIVWAAHGNNLAELASSLRQTSGVQQVASFGTKIHVTGTDEAQLDQAIRPYKEKYHWERIDANLEDVFIQLVGEAEDNYA